MGQKNEDESELKGKEGGWEECKDKRKDRNCWTPRNNNTKASKLIYKEGVNSLF